MPFFELREYFIKDKKMSQWLKFMHEVIIPYQIKNGVVLNASFQSLDDENKYIWIRRFDDENSFNDIKKRVYENNIWLNDILPTINELVYREKSIVTRLKATSISPIQ